MRMYNVSSKMACNPIYLQMKISNKTKVNQLLIESKDKEYLSHIINMKFYQHCGLILLDIEER